MQSPSGPKVYPKSACRALLQPGDVWKENYVAHGWAHGLSPRCMCCESDPCCSAKDAITLTQQTGTEHPLLGLGLNTVAVDKMSSSKFVKVRLARGSGRTTQDTNGAGTF